MKIRKAGDYAENDGRKENQILRPQTRHKPVVGMSIEAGGFEVQVAGDPYPIKSRLEFYCSPHGTILRD